MIFPYMYIYLYTLTYLESVPRSVPLVSGRENKKFDHGENVRDAFSVVGTLSPWDAFSVGRFLRGSLSPWVAFSVGRFLRGLSMK